ncbi:hypothetical protein BGZ63DRAFT_203252 [Mariannaea sp. PMI_226]|nr:hypothetical protein BGZ63DRAFT_203252 [Mariannaea sp. PMI_226]
MLTCDCTLSFACGCAFRRISPCSLSHPFSFLFSGPSCPLLLSLTLSLSLHPLRLASSSRIFFFLIFFFLASISPVNVPSAKRKQSKIQRYYSMLSFVRSSLTPRIP